MTEPVSSPVQVPTFALGEGAAAYRSVVDDARDAEWAVRLFDRDTSLWTDDPTVAAGHRRSPGLARRPDRLHRQHPGSRGVRRWRSVDAGFTTAVVAGMGGSSLAPDVLHRTFGSTDGYLALRILDSTDPEAVGGRARRPRSVSHARDRREQVGHDRRAQRVPRGGVASRERGRSTRSSTTSTRLPAPSSSRSPTRARASRRSRTTTHFREVFLNPPDIGGRYSALTYVGLVPASLIGLDLDALLASAGGDARRVPGAGPGRQPGRVARARARHAGPRRPRQADVPARRRDRVVRGLGGAAHRREHRQARRRDRAGRRRADRPAGGLRRRPGLRPHRPRRAATDGGRDALADALEASRPPGHPHRRSPTRSTSAPSSSAGRSRPRSPASSSASTRSTSPTSRRPSSDARPARGPAATQADRRADRATAG